MPLLSQIINNPKVLDSLSSISTKDGLSANRGKELFDNLQNKLDISSYNEYFKGVYLTYNALITANPTANLGCYALVDAGNGDEADFYWYDTQDGWITNGGMTLANTDVLVEGSTNLYFTSARVRSTILSGLSAGTNTNILSTDTIIGALAKLQTQLSSINYKEDVTFSTATLPDNQYETGTIAISELYTLLKFTSNAACRVRLYTTIAKRNLDVSRAVGIDPTGDHGLMFEFISTGILSADLSPIVDGFAETSNIPYTVNNLSGITQIISVTLNHIKRG